MTSTQPASPASGARAGLRAAGLSIRAVPALLRVSQWPKNGLVLAGPLAAASLTGGNASTPTDGVWKLATTLVCWCLISSTAYVANDLNDRFADRLHPEKRRRPLASGVVSPGPARVLAVVLALLSLAGGLTVGLGVAFLLVGYLALTLAYSAYAKNQPVVELLIVAAGFPMRALSGVAAIGLLVTPWFVLVISSAALFVVVSKRLSEIRRLGEKAAEHRPVLAAYSERFLTQTQTLSIAFFLGVYCIWSMSGSSFSAVVPGAVQLSLLPLVLVVLRFALLADRGLVDRPEALLYKDRSSQLAALGWMGLFLFGIWGWGM